MRLKFDTNNVMPLMSKLLIFICWLHYPFEVSGCEQNEDAGTNDCFSQWWIGCKRVTFYWAGARWSPVCFRGEIVADVRLKLERVAGDAVSSAEALDRGLSNTFYFSPPKGVLDG